MLNTARATRGMVVAPHHLAAQAGLRVLSDGGNAIEAMVAAAATIAVVYPHMNGLGGDNFWLIDDGQSDTPIAIDACGAAAMAADIAHYRGQGLKQLPGRGPAAAITMAGAISGWDAALQVSADWGGRIHLSRLFEDAIHHARHGMPMSQSQAENTRAKHHELAQVNGFAHTYLKHRTQVPSSGELFANPALAATFEHLAARGLDDFYRGQLGSQLAGALQAAGSPLALDDFSTHRALTVPPLSVEVSGARLFNLPPPTQGLASLLLLALYDGLRASDVDSFDYVHRLVECTKQAFLIRDAHVTDPRYMSSSASEWLSSETVSTLRARVDLDRASAWPRVANPGDTVWLGAIDNAGRAVSMIQSLYWEFGSGLTLTDFGITWQNRGTSFSLDHDASNPLMPGRRPFHTIQPALARFHDGRVMPYGCMGGEGQPQSQAAVFSRYAWYAVPLQEAVSAPRWLLGRTWGEQSTSLKLESRFDPDTVNRLRDAGHALDILGPFEETMGHAGALVRHRDGRLEGAADPRSDGIAAAW